MATSGASFGEGTGSIALNNVQCVGTEDRLADCPTGSPTSCDHSRDAGVRCHPQTGNEIHIIGVGSRGQFT